MRKNNLLKEVDADEDILASGEGDADIETEADIEADGETPMDGLNVEDTVKDTMTSVERRIKEKQDYKKKKQEAFLAKEALKDLE